MTLKQYNFRPAQEIGIGSHHRYVTTDTVSTVRSVGYFNQLARLLKVGDRIHVTIVDDEISPTILYGIYTFYVHSITSGVVRLTSTTRDGQMPTLVSPQPPNAMTWFEDFNTTSAAPYRYQVGETATPNTVTHQAAFGSADWVVTAIQGTTNLVGAHGSDGGENYIGCLALTAGNTSGDGVTVELGGRSTSPGNDVAVLGHPTTESVLMWRWRWDSGTDNHITGLGWLVTLPIGTDWLTDPDAAFAGTPSARGLIIHRNSNAAYSDDDLGDLVARYYDGDDGSTNTSLVLCPAESLDASNATWHKVEVRCESGIAYIYYNETYAGTIDMTNATGDNYRPVMGFKRTSSGGTRFLRVDAYLQEVETPINR